MYDPSIDSQWGTDANPVSTTPVNVVAAVSGQRIMPLTIVISNQHASDAAKVTLSDGSDARFSTTLAAGEAVTVNPKGWKLARGNALTAKLGAAGDCLVSCEYTTTLG